MSFKIGDRVRIRKDCRYYGDSMSNPKETGGTVIETFNDIGRLRVCWDNDYDNGYGVDDLEYLSFKPMHALNRHSIL
jgi:hypothetical protein